MEIRLVCTISRVFFKIKAVFIDLCFCKPEKISLNSVFSKTF